MAGCSIDDRFKHLKDIGRWLIAEVSHVWQMEYRELCDELHAKDLELDDAAEDIRLLVGDARRSNYDQSVLEWLLAEQQYEHEGHLDAVELYYYDKIDQIRYHDQFQAEWLLAESNRLLAESKWHALQHARRAEHYASALSADNQLSLWLLAEAQWKLDHADSAEVENAYGSGYVDGFGNGFANGREHRRNQEADNNAWKTLHVAAQRDVALWLLAEGNFLLAEMDEQLRRDCDVLNYENDMLAKRIEQLDAEVDAEVGRSAYDAELTAWLLAEKTYLDETLAEGYRQAHDRLRRIANDNADKLGVALWLLAEADWLFDDLFRVVARGLGKLGL